MTDHELIANLHRRMDTQDKMLLEIRDAMTKHLAESDTIKPALDELITLWKGSKILIPIIAGLVGTIWAVIVWARDNLR